MQKSFILLIIISLALACTPKQAGTEEQAEAPAEEAVEEAPATSISHADSVYVNGIITALTGIEKFGVGGNFNMMASLLSYKGDSERYQKIYDILQKKDEYVRLFTIQALDMKNGYLVYTPNDGDVTYTEVYWNMKDGSQLIATEDWECGPICSSGVSFRLYKDGVFTSIDREAVLPDLYELPKMILPDYDPDAADAEPEEFKFVLPQKGKNIRFCLDEKCIDLVWNEGTFVAKK